MAEPTRRLRGPADRRRLPGRRAAHRRRLRRLSVPQVRAGTRPGRHRALPRDPRRPPAARRLASQPARVDRAHRRAPARILSAVSDEIAELRARVEELERRVAVLFQQTGAADWEADARNAPPVSDEVRLLLGQGETRKAAKLYMQQTGRRDRRGDRRARRAGEGAACGVGPWRALPASRTIVVAGATTILRAAGSNLERDGEPARDRDQPVPAPAQGQPRRLVPVGHRSARARGRARPPDPAVDRLLVVPLVPRDGARVVRGSRDRAVHERALRADQGRSRGAPGRRLDLHGGGSGDDGPRGLAADRLPRHRRGAVLRRHLLPARATPGDAELPDGDGGHRAVVGHPARADRRGRRAHPHAARGGRADRARRTTSRRAGRWRAR